MQDNEELGVHLHMQSLEELSASISTGRRMPDTQYARLFDDGVAVVDLIGPIFPRANMMTMSGATSIAQFTNDVVRAYNSDDVRAVVMNIDSPGGDVRGIGESAHIINRLTQKGKKPLKSYAFGYMASAAYYVGSAAKDITANISSLTGSIGVVLTASKKEKGQIEIVSSQSPNKRPDVETEAGVATLQQRVDDLAEIFVNDVAKFRGIKADRVLSHYGQGDVFVGPRSKKQGLVDKLGSLSSVVMDAAKEAGASRSRVAMSGFAAVSALPEILQFSEEDLDMGLKDFAKRFMASDETTVGEQAQSDAANAGESEETSATASEGQGQEQQAQGQSDNKLTQLPTREELEERFADGAEAFALSLTLMNRIYPAQQVHAATALLNAKIDDALFAGSISFVNAEGLATEGTREDAVRAMFEAMPQHSLTQQAIKGLKDGSVEAHILTESDPDKATAEEGAITEERKNQLLGLTELGQRTIAARTN